MKTLIVAVMAFSLIFSLNAFAGFATADEPVFVNTDGFAGGVLHRVRSSNNDWEYIGCGVKRTADGLLHDRSFCRAGDPSGVEVFCTIRDDSVAETLSSMTIYSYVAFAWNPDEILEEGQSPTCTRIDVSNDSWNFPAAKADKGK